MTKKKYPKYESGAVISNPSKNKLSFAATEAYKLLRTNINFTLSNREECNVIGITSAIRGEGKSTTSINLSYTLAETGKRVLLIDADLRIPSVSKKLDIPATPGLSNVLISECSFNDALWKSPDLPNWHVLAAGVIPPNPTEMLGSSHIKELIASLKESYDFIIFDLPPVNLVADALVLSSYLTSIILIVRKNLLKKRELNKCTELIKMSEIKLLGFVLTSGADKKSLRFVNKGHYKNSKYYYSNTKKT